MIPATTDAVHASARVSTPAGPAQEVRSDGWTRVRDFLPETDLEPLQQEIEALFATEAPGVDPWGPLPARLSAQARSNIYRCLRYLPGLMRLAVNETLFNFVRDLGVRRPAIMQSHNVRMDGPGDDEHLFHWHQDFTYLLGSPNAMTLWLPLSRADAVHGSIQVVPATHREGVFGVQPVTTRHARPDAPLAPHDLVMTEPPAEDAGFIVEANRGDVVAFSGLTVHRSTPNLSDRIRWTAQLRYADLASPGFKLAGYPFGDATNIFHAGYRGTFYDPNT